MMEPKFAIRSQQQQQPQQQQQQSLPQQSQISTQLQQTMPDPNKSYNASEENRHYLKVFIQTYHNLPILWDTTLRDYSNREKRAEAYEQLVPIYRYLKRDANILDVKKKINTLRTNYRKELKMVEVTRKQGSVYQPRCWTYYELDFLRNAEKFLAVDPNHNIKSEPTPGSPPSSFAMFNESTHQGNFLEISPYGFRMNNGASPPPNISQMFHKSFGQMNDNTRSSQQKGTAASSNNLTGQETNLSSENPTAMYTHYQQQIQSTGNGLAGKRQRLSSNDDGAFCGCKCNRLDEEEALARTWAFKLKRLSREQRLYAEKFISDILFEAETGGLHRGSMQLNAFEPYVRFEESQPEDDSSRASHNNKAFSPNAVAASEAERHTTPAMAHNHMSDVSMNDVSDIRQMSLQQ